MKRVHPPAGGFRHRLLDRLGIAVSITCGLHCVALSALFVLYPALWLNRRYWEMGLWRKLLWVEWSLLATAVLLALLAMAAGWWRHRRWLPALLALCGLAALATGSLTSLHFQGYRGSSLALAGGLMVATGHWLNLRQTR